MLAGVGEEQDLIETVGRLRARLILQQALEDEVTGFLGRGRYKRAEEAVSHRNGYEPRTVERTAGPMRLERPPVRVVRYAAASPLSIGPQQPKRRASADHERSETGFGPMNGTTAKARGSLRGRS
ncbi:MAG: transposase [Solirubrobacteraceae bacterium]